MAVPDGKGLIVAVRPGPRPENLRLLGQRLKDEFAHVDHAVVMVFDDAEAVRLVRQGSRIIGEKKFQRALLNQRAMYLKSSARDEHSFTIYDTTLGHGTLSNTNQRIFGIQQSGQNLGENSTKRK